MSHFRRAYAPGGSFFFTVVERRAPILCTDTSCIFLRTAIRECRQHWPFRIDTLVVLPGNHLHAILTLPEGDTRYSARCRWIIKEFTKAHLAAGGNEGFPSFKARLSRSWLACRIMIGLPSTSFDKLMTGFDKALLNVAERLRANV